MARLPSQSEAGPDQHHAIKQLKIMARTRNPLAMWVSSSPGNGVSDDSWKSKWL